MDIASEGTHQGENYRPFTVIVDFIHLVHERCPLLERDLLIYWNILVHQLRYQLIFVGLSSGSGIYSREGREIVIHVIMGHYTQLVDLLVHIFSVLIFMDYAIGEGEKLLIGFSAHSF